MLNLVESRRYWFILLVQTLVFFITPFAREHRPLFFLFLFGLFGILVAAILTIWEARLPRLLAIGSAVAVLATGLMASPSLRFEDPTVLWLSACTVSYALFILIAIVSIGADVLFRERVTLDCILGSICVYMFLGIFFAFVFGLFALLLPGSFNYGGEGGSPWAVTLNGLLYFSYSTLTTTGYGDITPARPFVRSVAVFESIAGTLYIALMITRLVSLHAADRGAGGLDAAAHRGAAIPEMRRRRRLL
ncbi:MAG: ion channel [bacterium]